MIRTMTARPAGDEIWIEGPNLKGQPLRWIFLQITSHSFHWSNFVSEDGGQTWCFQEEADHLPSLREPDAYGAPQSSDSDDTPGRHATHPSSVYRCRNQACSRFHQPMRLRDCCSGEVLV